MQRLSRVLPLAATLVCAAAAQTGGPPTAFEVASIKPAAPQDMGRMRIMMRGGPGTDDPGQITYVNVPLRNIVMNAYGVKNFQISGPGWLDTGHFDVLAKVPKGATEEDLKIMLQNLLAERFQLKLHREKKELPIYALVVARNGPKLKESAEDTPAAADAPAPPPPSGGRVTVGKDGFPQMPRGGRGGMMMMINNGRLRLAGYKQSISAMTDMLSNQVGRPVVDQTGLTGKYDFSLEFAPEEGQMMRGPMGAMPPPPPGAGPGPADSAPDSPAPANLFTALQEQLGLKLEPKKGPVDFLVIDHIEKTPSEN
jgi:uncharacterized protein (TIGR03435 family)